MQYIFIWSPYQGNLGERRLIDHNMVVGLKAALDIAYENRHVWRKQYGDGQVIVAAVASYMGLH